MSKPGYHHTSLWGKDKDRPAPCFKCATEPRLEGHSVCSGCHREESCPRCHPSLNYVAPARLSRGALSAEAESGSETRVVTY